MLAFQNRVKGPFSRSVGLPPFLPMEKKIIMNISLGIQVFSRNIAGAIVFQVYVYGWHIHAWFL